MASGLIYLIILMMWGAYFVPRWMSQHDTTSGRATARYKSAMKVVASTPNIPEAETLIKKKIKNFLYSVIANNLKSFYNL